MLNPQTDLVSDEQLLHWITTEDPAELEALFAAARAARGACYGETVFVRGLIEFSNYCRNDCYYCGIRRSNRNVDRYRLSLEGILECCRRGDALGFRTFVLQSGEDPWFTDERMEAVVRAIRREFPEHAITLSIGERPRESYQRLFAAGADRFLLRHETADEAHYRLLHPPGMSLRTRKECLFALRAIGYQVGAGFMVGSPRQTPQTLLADLRFLQELRPQMVGIGPFIPQADTPFAAQPGGTVEQTVRMVALCRLLLPDTLLPATTALGTIASDGRERGLMAGANVVMPNLSPLDVRDKYALYDNKICTGDEAAECLGCIGRRIQSCGLEVAMARGDHAGWVQ